MKTMYNCQFTVACTNRNKENHGHSDYV